MNKLPITNKQLLSKLKEWVILHHKLLEMISEVDNTCDKCLDTNSSMSCGNCLFCFRDGPLDSNEIRDFLRELNRKIKYLEKKLKK